MIRPLRKIIVASFSCLLCCYLLFFSVGIAFRYSWRQPTCRRSPPHHTLYLRERRHEPSIQAIAWNRQKRVTILCWRWSHALSDVVYRSQRVSLPYATRNLDHPCAGSSAFLLLHIVLCIGRSAGWTRKFFPYLYRRHLGVLTFLWDNPQRGPSDSSPVSVTRTRSQSVDFDQDFGSLPDFPFQQLGFLALVILFLMAADEPRLLAQEPDTARVGRL